MRRFVYLPLLSAALVLAAAPARAQSAPATTAAVTTAVEPLRVYLDCDGRGCDDDFFVTEMPFVDFIRDRTASDVHLLIVSLSTGAGGRQYTVSLIGQRRFAGRADTLTAVVGPNGTDDAHRRELSRVIKLGLVRYAAATPAGTRLRVVVDSAPAAAKGAAAKAVVDKWNGWVYRVGVNGNFGGESQSKRTNGNGNVSARRITKDVKLTFEANTSYRESRYNFDDGTSSTYINRSNNANGRWVKSITDHWSAGLSGDVGQSDFSNHDLFAKSMASVEYNFFPWSQATERQFVAVYGLGMEHNRYKEQTIYFKDRETLPSHQVIVAMEQKQTWGSMDVSLRASQYLHDFSKQNLSISGETDIRISGGLSFSLSVYASKVSDQLFLAAGTLSREEILTQQRALQTDFQYGVHVGLSYTFGSLFNSTVNPRLDSMNGGGRFFF